MGNLESRRVRAGLLLALFAVFATTNAFPAELTRARFVAQVSDYFGWYHASGYNDYWKVPLRTFTDVKAEDRYGRQIENAYEENIISPDPRGRFNPGAPMTREDAAVIFVKAFFLPTPADTAALDAFGDAGRISAGARHVPRSRTM